MTNSNVVLYPQHCFKCGFDWESTSELPDRCKQCRSYYYDMAETVTPNDILQPQAEQAMDKAILRSLRTP